MEMIPGGEIIISDDFFGFVLIIKESNMQEGISVRNGTYKQLTKDTEIVAVVNSESNIKISVYLSEREKYVSEFNLWSKKTAQASLEMGRVVYSAKQNLSKEEFEVFVSDVKAGSTVRKYLAIGKHYDKFYQYAELLPNAWTSIYEITLLPADVFDALVATESSMANMTGAQLKLLKGTTEDRPNTPASAVDSTTAAQKSAETSEDINAVTSKTEASAIAAASSDVKQTDSIESSAESASVSADATASDYTSCASDHEFAKQATNTMLERVAATASATVDAEAEEVFAPYEVTIRFNKMPSDEAKLELAEYVYKVKNKYCLDIEVVNNSVEV